MKMDIDLIENVQRKFTKLLPGLFDTPYLERLQLLKLLTLEERRIYSDIVLLYKIIHGLVDIQFHDYFRINTSNTRGHAFKLEILSVRLNCQKYHFFNRTVKIWNSIPSEIVCIGKLAHFKKQILNFNVKNYCIGRAILSPE